MAYPSNIDNFTPHVDGVDDVMAVDVNELQDAIKSLESKVGADSSTVSTSHDYKISALESGYVKLGGNTLGSKKLIGSNDNQDVGFITNNTERLTILKNGNVGIGTTGPTVKLEVVGNDSYAPLKISRNSNDKQIGVSYYPAGTLSNSNKAWIMGLEENSNDFSFYTWSGSGSVNNVLYLTNSNNVGIGKTNPTASLHLRAGTATAGTAPIKLTAGVLNTTPEAGTIEFDGTDLYLTI